MASRFLTLENAIDYLETLPPEAQINAEEDDLDEAMPLDVCGEVDVTVDSDRIVNEDDVYVSSDSQTWSKRKPLNHIFENIPVLPLSTVAPELISLTLIELFYKIMPKEEMSHFAEITKRYALQNGVTLSVEEEDIEHVPSEFMFWSTTRDFAVSIASDTMSRNRFRDLKKYFHVVDNMTLQEGDKLAKISPVCKMFIKGKPIRFGFKVWTMASSSGYLYAMQIYAGKESDKKNEPLGLRVVKHMVSYLNEHNKYHVYFDNFFTLHHLFKELTQRGIKATGTIRNARISNCPLMKPEIFESWKKHVDITEPNIIRQYNKYMGGVDVMDKVLSSYRPKFRSRKWWWNLFSHALNMAVVAAWKLYMELHTATNDRLSHLQFRREISIHFLHARPFVRSYPGPRSHLPIRLWTSHGHYL
ncbi:PiggyBac transposable element-derived protein 3 [Trichinella patagoniensis]|uniref:PiggyBac transposable element-derived protein 3 n=1 Tax=Trichinella patagoniensis TaxID=990121 RepID=A0A0V0Z9E9_9BILA|nr:PiggyBac transposable element-derived protein 3 [Trichinella patagoniensis]